VPGGQGRHGVQATLFASVVKVALGQRSHTRSEVGVGSSTTYHPGSHTVSGRHAPPAT